MKSCSNGEGQAADAQPGGYIQVDAIRKSFGMVRAVDNVSLDIRKSEFFTLIGSSGCGKSTLLRILAGFIDPDEGRVQIGGLDVTRLPPHKRPTNMVFQSYALFPHMSVASNVKFGLNRERLPSATVKSRANEALAIVGMTQYADRRPHELSGGQRQRVALARAIAKRPQVLLLDEPLSALDKRLREMTQLELINIQKQIGITFVMVTHDQQEAMTMSSRIAVMSEGRILQIGRPTEIYQSPNSRFVAEFLGWINIVDGQIVEISGDVAIVECKGVGRFRVRSSSQLLIASGNAVGVAIRPERLSVAATSIPAEAVDSVEGTVTAVAFVGDRWLYSVRLRNNQEFKVSQDVATMNGPPPELGSAIKLFWQQSSAFLLETRAD